MDSWMEQLKQMERVRTRGGFKMEERKKNSVSLHLIPNSIWRPETLTHRSHYVQRTERNLKIEKGWIHRHRRVRRKRRKRISTCTLHLSRLTPWSCGLSHRRIFETLTQIERTDRRGWIGDDGRFPDKGKTKNHFIHEARFLQKKKGEEENEGNRGP